MLIMLISFWELSKGTIFTTPNTKNICGYIDDPFFIWTGTTQELVELYIHIDKFHKTKKFAIEHSKNKIVF